MSAATEIAKEMAAEGGSIDRALFQLERFTQIHGDRAARPALDHLRADLAQLRAALGKLES